jgi:hypothetical protein
VKKGTVPILIRTSGVKYYYDTGSGGLRKLNAEDEQRVKEQFKDLSSFIKQEEKEIQLNRPRSPAQWKPGDPEVVIMERTLGDVEEGLADEADADSGQGRKQRRNRGRNAKTKGNLRRR